MNLLKIGAEFRALDELLEEANGDISTDGAEAAVVGWFESLTADEASKLDGYFYYIQTLEMEAEQARKLAKELSDKARTRESRIEWLKTRMLTYLTMANRKDAITASGHKISVQKNTTRPLVYGETFTPDDVPEQFLKRTVELDAAAIRKALKDGPLPFVKLGEAGQHIRLKA